MMWWKAPLGRYSPLAKPLLRSSAAVMAVAGILVIAGVGVSHAQVTGDEAGTAAPEGHADAPAKSTAESRAPPRRRPQTA
ncbi:hypothetical protein A7A08_01482 [Methyloligella halotolerans]|uniref:Uncharacterized protein n=1 Tax=Methyloligella halotolerans TaxID=1177755 RepID=A0A1E2RZ67_9HYPH|nr:hypothetical protein [Methyloligella halotolerans]ODA67450.1 hypothetical protein A7A08_01482 [Methyloligella halotolerans]